MIVKVLALIAGIMAAASVLLSAWLSHAGRELSLTVVNNLETAILFAFIHSIAVFIALSTEQQKNNGLALISACGFAFGLVAFSLSIMIKSLFAITLLSVFTPLGGIAFAIAWLLLAIAFTKSEVSDLNASD
ncbi:DUF423 domain-containing protein [Thalassotalea crassostreae]|uniref:DUF423 domain-containing protein n=1 Tax=Thalassotalea crassostreae TaxID=1763536 RepID=UPI0008387B68|nr:DUF423 domain-containing protein [Thalassotalea crassostreae]